MKHGYPRFAFYFLLFLSLHLIFLLSFHVINTRSMDAAVQHSDPLLIDDILESRGNQKSGRPEDNPVTVYPVTEQSGRDSALRFVSEKSLPFSLLLEDTHVPYILKQEGQVIAQNVRAEEPAYQSNRAYIVLHFGGEDYRQDGDFSVVELTLEQQFSVESMKHQSYVLLGSEDALRNLTERRLMLSSFFFAGFLLILFVSLFVYVSFRKTYMLYALLLSFVGAYKFLLTGDLPLTLLTGTISTLQLNMHDLFTGIIIFLLSQLLCRSLYGFRTPKRFVGGYLVLFFAGELLFLFTFNIEIMIFMHILGSLLILYMGGSTRSANRKHGLLVTLGYSLFSVSVTYQFLVTLEISPRNVEHLMLFSPQFGSIIYLTSIVLAVIMSYADTLTSYQKQQRTYEKTRLLQGISHDLKLPLSAIKINMQMLESYELPDTERAEIMESVMDATDELEQMTENINVYLHAVSTVENGGETNVPERMDRLARRYAQYGESRGVVLHSFIDEKEALLPVSPLTFDRLVSNLLENAFTYNREDGEVSLSYTHRQTYITVAVTDTGIGMDEQTLAHILEPFYRVDTSRNLKGSGLGLSVVKAVAENLDAELRMESVPDTGTRISLDIPLK
ncbi:MAG: sensor histidine kinase [Sphaerochaetaceae bacterium]|nr:sensor histidine kinase [Sphaerochaetaceae bacterium]